jgi:hypothetical protein
MLGIINPLKEKNGEKHMFPPFKRKYKLFKRHFLNTSHWHIVDQEVKWLKFEPSRSTN